MSYASAFQGEKTLLTVMGAVGLFGCVAMIVGNIIGSLVVPGHDFVADTISDLGAGKYEIIQDVAFYGFAASLMACALGAAHFHPSGWRWNMGIFSLALLVACTVIIGARNEYGDGDSEGIVIHIYVVYAIGVLFAATFWGMAQGMGEVGTRYKTLSLVCAGLWIVATPVFFFLPTNIDGLYERMLGGIALTWVATFSWMLIRIGRGCD